MRPGEKPGDFYRTYTNPSYVKEQQRVRWLADHGQEIEHSIPSLWEMVMNPCKRRDDVEDDYGERSFP